MDVGDAMSLRGLKQGSIVVLICSAGVWSCIGEWVDGGGGCRGRGELKQPQHTHGGQDTERVQQQEQPLRGETTTSRERNSQGLIQALVNLAQRAASVTVGGCCGML